MDKILNRIEENEFYTQETEGDIVRFSKKYVVDDEDHNGQQTTLKLYKDTDFAKIKELELRKSIYNDENFFMGCKKVGEK